MDRSDIQKLADLARIEITEDSADNVVERINDVLALVDQLQAVDTSHIDAMAHPLDAVQRLRDDTVTEAVDRESYQAIAPEAEDGLYLVPKVIE